MNFTFRADASNEIGAGHVMRCQALAFVLKKQGHEVDFLCQDLQGNLAQLLRENGFKVTLIPIVPSIQSDKEVVDARYCLKTSAVKQADWLIVDHYSLGKSWENQMQSDNCKLMVIDDLANRPHKADIILDQNLVQAYQSRYDTLVPASCTKLLGPKYSLVREEFASWRGKSLERKSNPDLNNILVFMGGGDVFKETKCVLDGLLYLSHVRIDVIVGSACSSIEQLQQLIAKQSNWTLHIQTNEMPCLLAKCDLAITGGGSISWEKCVLGVPSVVATLADNQIPVARALDEVGAQIVLGSMEQLTPKIFTKAIRNLSLHMLREMSLKASAICDHLGCERVADILITGN